MKCTSFKPFESGCLKGFANLEITIEGKKAKLPSCKLFEKESSSWIAIQGIKGTDKEGQECFFPAFSFFSREDKQAFSDSAVDAIKLFMQEESRKEVNKSPSSDSLKDNDIFNDKDFPF